MTKPHNREAEMRKSARGVISQGASREQFVNLWALNERQVPQAAKIYDEEKAKAARKAAKAKKTLKRL